MNQRSKFEGYMREKIPGFEVRYKDTKYPDDPWLRKFIDFFGRLFAPAYNETFATTIYPYVYLPRTWTDDVVYRVLRHEYIHLRDEKRFGWLFKLSYVFLLPFMFTMRGYWERRGYAQTLMVRFEETGNIPVGLMDFVSKQFIGRNYGWMDPFRGRSKITDLSLRIMTGEIDGLWPYNEGDWT